MELVLNPKQVNTLRSSSEEEPVEFGGILNSAYKNKINHVPRDPRSLLSEQKRLYNYELRHTQNIETILKLFVFTVVLIMVII